MKVCDQCKGEEEIASVHLQTRDFAAQAELCKPCREKLPEAIEGLGFTIADPTQQPRGLGSAGMRQN